MLTTTKPLTLTVALPSNITPIATQLELVTHGVRLLRFVQVADEAEAVEKAGIEKAYLLKSNILENCYYLIFPIATVTEYIEEKRQQ